MAPLLAWLSAVWVTMVTPPDFSPMERAERAMRIKSKCAERLMKRVQEQLDSMSL